jgi:hypothetical protein
MRVWRTADLSWLRSSSVATGALEALLPKARDLAERPQRQASAIPDVSGLGASRISGRAELSNLSPELPKQ